MAGGRDLPPTDGEVSPTTVGLLPVTPGVPSPLRFPPPRVPSPQFGCCGGVSYKDWSQNMYFNCTAANPSRERCSVPFSCCLRDASEVRMAASGWGGHDPRSAPLLPSLRAALSPQPPPQEREPTSGGGWDPPTTLRLWGCCVGSG